MAVCLTVPLKSQAPAAQTPASMPWDRPPASGFPADVCRYSPEELLILINRYLPEDIRVLDCRETEERFHARLLAKSKIYEYRIDNGPWADVFSRRFALHVPDLLDTAAMQGAAGPPHRHP